MTNKDDLFERHKEREDKALTTIAGLFVLACVLATTVGSLFSDNNNYIKLILSKRYGQMWCMSVESGGVL